MRKANKTINILNLEFSINGLEVVLSTQEILTISIDNLGEVISPLKILIKIHRGLSKNLKLKIVDDYLVSYKKRE